MRILKLPLAVLAMALLLLHCSKSDELLPAANTSSGSTTVPTTTTSTTTSPFVAQIMALPSFQVYYNLLMEFPNRAFAYYNALPTEVDKVNYIHVRMQQAEPLTTASEVEAWLQSHGWSSTSEFESWLSALGIARTDLENDPFFDNVPTDQLGTGIGDAIGGAGGVGVPPVPPSITLNGCDELQDCVDNEFAIYEANIAFCSDTHGPTSQLISTAAWTTCMDHAEAIFWSGFFDCLTLSDC